MEDWQTKKLGEASTLITSGSRGWAGYYADKGAKFIRITNLPRVGIKLLQNDMKYVQLTHDSSEGTRTKLQYQDVLISITAELGKIAYIAEDLGEAYINQHVALVRIDRLTNSPKFIAYALSTGRSRRLFNRRNDSGAKAGLNLAAIDKFPLCVPDLSEQERIVRVLEVWDEYIEKLERKIELKERLMVAIRTQLMTQRLRYKSFEVPWRFGRLAQMLELLKDGTHGTHKDALTGPSLLSAKDIHSGMVHIPQDARKISNDDFLAMHKTYRLQEGDLLLTIVGTIGRVAMVGKYNAKYTFQRSVAILRFGDMCNKRFMYHLLSSYVFRRELLKRESRGAQGGVYLGDLSKIQVKLPSLEEQGVIAAMLDRVSDEIGVLNKLLGAMKRQKQYLLKNLLSGTIRTPENLSPRKEAA